MGVFSEMDIERKEKDGFILPPQNTATNDTHAPAPYTGETKQQPYAGTAVTKQPVSDNDDEPSDDEGYCEPDDEPDTDPEEESEPEKPAVTEDKKKAEHDAAEAKRKAEWEAKQAGKKAALAKALNELLSMSDDDVMGSSIKRTGDDLERLTRRNMKMCVTEHIQTLCLDDPAFARLVCHPVKNMVNCFKYINKKAEVFVKEELEQLGQKPIGTVGEDVPDDLCYKWAEDYFRDTDAEVDKDKDDTFEPKKYYGGPASSKAKKKDPPKKETPSEKKPTPESGQLDLFGGAAA